MADISQIPTETKFGYIKQHIVNHSISNAPHAIWACAFVNSNLSKDRHRFYMCICISHVLQLEWEKKNKLEWLIKRVEVSVGLLS